MTRKRFVKLMRALNAQVRKDGYPDELREATVNRMHCHKMRYVRGYQPIYQDLWTLNREVKRREFLELLDKKTEERAKRLELDDEQIKDAIEIVRVVAIAARPIFCIEK